MRIFIVTVLVLIFLFAEKIFSQPSDTSQYTVRFSSRGINDELSQGFVPVIFQDHRGFMWFATKDGLNKYDGYKFSIYRHDANDPASVADNFVNLIFEDSRGYLWMSPVSGGLDVFDPFTEQFYFVDLDKNPNAEVKDCSFMMEDAEGNLWFKSHQGYFEINITPKKKQKGSSLNDRYEYIIHPASEVLSKQFYFNQNPSLLCFDYKKNLWITSGDSLYEIPVITKPGKKEVHRYKQSEFCQFPQCKIFQVISDSMHHHLYFLTTSGIAIYDTKTSGIAKTSALDISELNNLNGCSLDAQGNLWFNFAEGFFFYDVALNHFRKISPFNTDNNTPLACEFKSVLADRGGIIWAGTNGYGVYRFNPRVEKFHKIAGIPGLVGGVRGIKGDNEGRIFVYSSVNNQILNPAAGAIEKVMFNGGKFALTVNGETVTSPITFIQDSSGIFWLGYGHGYLARYDEKKDAIHFFHLDSYHDKTAPTYLWLDNHNKVWMIVQDLNSQAYITHFDNQKESFEMLIPFPEKISVFTYPFISSVIVGVANEFWFGTVQGLFCYHPDTKNWDHFTNIPGNKNSLSNNTIFSLCPDPKYPQKYLWIGTSSGGLNRLDIVRDSFIYYTDKDGLPNNVIYGILSDNSGNLWLSTNKGLCRFNSNTKECTNYYASDGLQANEFNRYAYYKSKSGELFFGGVSGLNFFYPAEITSNVVPPPIAFTDFRLLNKSVSIDDPKSPLHKPIDYVDEITLAHNQNMITLEFTALDFSAPEKNKYKYKLDGFDEDWVSSGTRHEVTYTNLEHGTYTFTVKAANSEGAWNETGRTIRIVITPPWWKTWWARTLFVLIVISSILAFIRYRTASLRISQKNLEKKVEERTRELNESLEHLQQTQDQLVQQEKLASLGQLTAGIAHEIRNPLNFVNNFSELSSELISEMQHITSEAERNEILADLKINLDKIKQHGKRADSIVKNMLDHARASTGEKQLTDMNQLCEEFLELAYHGMRASRRDFNCRLEKHFDPELPSANIVTQDLSRVLLNLYNNAFDAVYEKTMNGTHNTTDDKKYQPTVFIMTQALDHSIVIKVKDNGNGIPPVIREKIFEPFFTTKPTGQGTGLGLSISYDIVKAHGGEMKVDSRENEFTEFTIVLPA